MINQNQNFQEKVYQGVVWLNNPFGLFFVFIQMFSIFISPASIFCKLLVQYGVILILKNKKLSSKLTKIK